MPNQAGGLSAVAVVAPEQRKDNERHRDRRTGSDKEQSERQGKVIALGKRMGGRLVNNQHTREQARCKKRRRVPHAGLPRVNFKIDQHHMTPALAMRLDREAPGRVRAK